jgi:hypothetical protein
MASIEWYRGAGKRVLTPRRDKPRAPKNVRPKKPKKLGLPRFPKIEKPRVHLPFVQAYNNKFHSNLSAAGLSEVMRIAERNHLKAGEVRWVRGSELSHRREDGRVVDECPLVEGRKLCDILGIMSWGTLDEFISDCGGSDKAEGIWAMSHINCRCHITIKLFDPASTGRYAIFEVYTNPLDGAGRSVTVAAGFAWASGTIPESELVTGDFEHITELNKMDSTDADERELARIRHDVFDVKRMTVNAPAVEEETLEEQFGLPVEPEVPAEEAAKPVPPVALTPEEEEERRRQEEEAQKGFLG